MYREMTTLIEIDNKEKEMAWSIIKGKPKGISTTLQHLKKQNEPHYETLYRISSYFKELQCIKMGAHRNFNIKSSPALNSPKLKFSQPKLFPS